VAEPALWTVEGRHNRVHLFGSVHMLADDDFDFPGPPGSSLAAAYRDAEALIMEVAPADADGPPMLSATALRAMDPQGRTLDELLGSQADAVRAAAARAGIDLAPLARFEPWFASLVITVQSAMKQGLVAEHGVEQRVAAIASRDGKPIAGLESVDQQLALFDDLAPALQSELLLKTIDESAEDDRKLAAMVAAWQRGDLAALDRLMTEEFAAFPALRGPLLVERNRAWIGPILDLLDDERDYLIVVGALHLVGRDGVVALLAERGVKARRR
jgi:uncharacterized protein YbaP (TraB family)